MCGYAYKEDEPRDIETEVGELMHERRVCRMNIELEKQAEAYLTERIALLRDKEKGL